jgi:hypothetical protein
LLCGLALMMQEPRDGQRPATRGATIRGHVTAAATGQPLHRVRITLDGSQGNPPTAVTDTRGAFELTDLPAGTYTITATRAGFLTVQYGQRRQRERGRRIEIRAGDTVEGIDFALVKGAVISGRVLDEVGDPAPGTRVDAIELRYVRGRRVPVTAALTRTNDAGGYRLTGLAAGSYQVRASTTDVWDGDDGKSAFAHAMTFYPGVIPPETPLAVQVGPGGEVPGIDLQLVPTRAARLSGIVEDVNGVPQAGQVVHLGRTARTIGGATWYSEQAGTTRTDDRGAFEFQKLSAGEYIANVGGEAEAASVTVHLGDGDTQHILLTPRKALELTGTIVTDDGSRPPFATGGITVVPVSTDPRLVFPSFTTPRMLTLRTDWTFRTSALNGEHLFRLNGLPDEWMLKTVTSGGRDITDVPIALGPGLPPVPPVQITITKAGARITGQVLRGDASAADSTVILFPEDMRLWGVGSRFVRAVRPDNAGRFSIGALPAAKYRIAAVEIVQDGEWEDPEFLQTLMKSAAAIELPAGATHEVGVNMEASR